jgi:stage V sporulation protein G
VLPVEITEVKIFPVLEEKVKAYVTIVLSHCFVIRDVKIIEANEGLFVAMPSKKLKDGTYRDVAHPLNKSTRALMEQAIIDAYQKSLLTLPAAKSNQDPNREVPNDILCA